MRTLIKNSTIICPVQGELIDYDLLIENQTIAAVAPQLNETADLVINASGLHVLPGLLDMHCHLREPGYEHKETLETGLLAALKGGFTAVVSMHNTAPVVDSKMVVNYIRERGRELNLCKIYPAGCISKGQESRELANIGALKAAGCVAITDDGKPVATAALMQRALMYAHSFGIPVLTHAEEQSLSDNGVMNEGLVATTLGLRGIPVLAEELATARDILIAESLDVPIHIMHVSTAGSVALIRAAKERGARVTAETCPHYFSLSDYACDDFDTSAKVNPPLRSDADIDAIIAGLKDGTIDCIATDHAPHHRDDKNCEFAAAAFGISGLETAFAVAYTYLVLPGHLSLTELIGAFTARPADILHLPAKQLSAGNIADLCIVDLKAAWTVDSNTFVSKGQNTPFNGYELFGQVVCTIVDGAVKYQMD